MFLSGSGVLLPYRNKTTKERKIMKLSARNSKLQVTLGQWIEIHNNEMAISEDLRKSDVIDQSSKMINKIKGMMSE